MLMSVQLLLSVIRLDTASHPLHFHHLNLTTNQVYMLLSHSSNQLLVNLHVSLIIIFIIGF